MTTHADGGGAAVVEIFDRARSMTEKVIRENERLRHENEELTTRYLEIEQQNTNLANLYVASYQLHSTLEFREVIKTVEEIIINLVGAEVFAILLYDESSGRLQSIAWEGSDILPGVGDISVALGDGMIGAAALTGENHYLPEGTESTIDQPLAALPLKIKEAVIGEIVIYRLLQHKEYFSALDYELFSLLAFHAATAIFSSKLYSQSARKLNTIQSFLELLTT
jgi:nitrate/nitrite-specific signal transduction histidine kinase